MQLHHFFDEVQPQASAFAPTVRAWQGVETLAEAGQGILRNRLGLVEQAELDLRPQLLGKEPQHALGRGEVQGVFQQIANGLAQQERLTDQGQIRIDALFDLQLLTLDPRALALQQLIDQGRQRHLDSLFQPLALLDLGQVQQALDQLLHACAFTADVADKALLLLHRHLALQQLRGATNRRQRAFQFVGQGVHITFDVGLALKLGAHVLHRRGQLLQLTTTVMRQCGTPAFADRLGIGGQAAQRRAEPPGQQRAEQQAQGNQADAVPHQTAFGAVDIRLQRAVGFGHGDHADDLALVTDRRAHVHDRRVRIIGHRPRRTRTVLAAQGQVHVVPARIILAHRDSAGVQHHLALVVGDIDAVVDLVLRQAPDTGRRLPLAVGLEQLRPAVFIEGAGLEVVAQDFGHQVGGVHQGFFGGLAHAGADFLHHGAEHKVAGQADKQRIHQEDPDAEGHQL